ncbi:MULTISPECIES: fimbrial protein [Paraburkholderia]|uniref:fimbrial protein n=1 Tax=Paraburkholderia TaxID=1822464 RepID=UPI002254148D|nr:MULTISPECIES: fimbrial protein [Paraburkholderia]MCX4162427.1 fimbrial protein [Paraburkholderia megapolitana]MDN7157922.1 fimbrial protein [Paraburkholderia sp. CHISQ3]MDQ6494969.1 fimbrial protein [Paraburkholderia megapolitana]
MKSISNKFLLLSAVSLATLSASTIANAQSVTGGQGVVRFTGTIVAGACGIEGVSQDQTVNLGGVPTNAFKAVGDKSAPQSFDIKLTQCDTTTLKNAFFRFTGTSNAAQAGLFATVGSARNVGIRLQSASGEFLDNGTEQRGQVVLNDGTNVVRFAAMYEATAANVTAGTADGVANFTVRYQ